MIKIFTLNSADDIIGEMLDEDENYFIVKDPLIIKYGQTIRSGMYVQLKFFGMFSDDDIFAFKKSSITSVCNPKENMAEYYRLSVEVAKSEFMPDVDEMINDSISAIKNYKINKGADEALSKFLENIPIKTMQ